nr:immunoglobulin heavy chain junction region [Macaca mulatta]MOX91581.1 immunoglobulin heavy chain junction region [Macaca mulatta]MOX91629.1 immunoglobulin heavy chain junction region [Macaca mulatta]MOX91760.1 immunoglobulin heavy chain junction region [Macaca mulatta]MOX91800.1 immunoglobulin heavy chain junction region [Macaca mulatta]
CATDAVGSGLDYW